MDGQRKARGERWKYGRKIGRNDRRKEERMDGQRKKGGKDGKMAGR